MSDVSNPGNQENPGPSLWERVDVLLAFQDDPPQELRGIAGWRAQERGDLETAQRFVDYRRSIAFAQVTVRPLLERIRHATGQPLLLLKGPEVAALYPNSTLRPFGDLDLLVPDAVAAEASLLAAGFVLASAATTGPVPWHHHRLPLRLPGMPLSVELHINPGWLTWMTPPSNRELFQRAIPSATGVDGVVTLPPLEHTLFLALHAWRHGPFHSLLHLIDIELMRQRGNANTLTAIAHTWGLARVWRHTFHLLDWCFSTPDRRLSPLELAWSYHLRAMQPRSRRALAIALRTNGLGATSAREFAYAFGIDIARSSAPRAGETYASATRRVGQKLRD